MALNSPVNNVSHQPQHLYSDLNSLQDIRQLGKQDKSAALMEVARQFESMFLNMMLSSMRQANSVFTEDSLLNSPEMDFYQGMYDNQLAMEMSGNADRNGAGSGSGKGGSQYGLADVIYRQLMSNYNSNGDIPELDQGKLFDRRVAGTALQQAMEEVDAVRQQLQQASQAPGGAAEPAPEVVLAGADNPTTDSPNNPSAAASGAGDKGQQFATPEAFVAAVYPHAEVIAEQLGVDARAIVAQAALETGWGQHMITDEQGRNSFNFFGIKADSRWQGESVSVMTHEYRQGARVNETAAFRSYGSLQQGLADYADFLMSSERYQSALGQGLGADQYGHALQQAGYATDPEYGAKIDRIARSEWLKQQSDPDSAANPGPAREAQ